jgi:hypothetical protein
MERIKLDTDLKVEVSAVINKYDVSKEDLISQVKSLNKILDELYLLQKHINLQDNINLRCSIADLTYTLVTIGETLDEKEADKK